MRVVEPSSFKKMPEPRNPRLYRRVFIGASIFVLAGCVFILRSDHITSSTESVIVESEQELAENTEDGLLPGELRTFSGNEFKIFYDNLRQPNLDKVDVPPSISGNDVADARIRQIAERRGYKLRSSPTVNLPSFDGYPMQEAVHEPWRLLKQAALNDGVSFTIVSAYRSVENQRQLFMSQLRAEGVNISDVEKGIADAEIDRVLITTSIPGYSKHHTGYTVDLLCAGFDFDNFLNSPCNEWLMTDNYRAAKEFGFIPSYPPDADLQGPAPEAWEYVWVGTELLVKQ